MKKELLQYLRCPKTGQKLHLKSQTEELDIKEGSLVSQDQSNHYPIIAGIPRFVPQSNYADNFGMQWNEFGKTQLDSFSGQIITADRFWNATNWEPKDLKGKLILDVGCGAGRFAEVALSSGAIVIAVDMSNAVEACAKNLKDHKNLHLVQGDIYSLPFAPEIFQYVYSLGVLQHTPDVETAFSALPIMVKPGGLLCTDYYWKRFRTLMHAKYFWRPITKRMNQVTLFKLLQHLVPYMLISSQILGRIPLIGKAFKRIIPVADYTDIFPLSDKQLTEWALLDTFDMLAPQYDNPQTAKKVYEWFTKFNFLDVEVLHASHLVARGRKPSNESSN